jgi:FKBP-type peptidyl-prolyl cis-trans isomerase FkpA
MITLKSPLSAKAMLAGILSTLIFCPISASFAQTGTASIAQAGKQIPDAEIYEAIGMILADGTGLGRMQFTDAQIDLILTGMKKGIKTKTMPPDSLQSKIQALMMQKMQLARQAEQAEGSKLAAGNKAKGKAFLEKISKQAGVTKDPSGFYYVILKKGTGATPTMNDTVKLHYHGTLIDGTVFDSSVDRGEPTSFPMNGVIKGFSGGLTKCQVGGKVRIYIPSELGYGDNPRPGGKIKPGDTLIFECELLEIK